MSAFNIPVISRFFAKQKMERKRRQIEEKYKNVFLMLNMDFNLYKVLIKVKNDELAENGL